MNIPTEERVSSHDLELYIPIYTCPLHGCIGVLYPERPSTHLSEFTCAGCGCRITKEDLAKPDANYVVIKQPRVVYIAMVLTDALERSEKGNTVITHSRISNTVSLFHGRIRYNIRPNDTVDPQFLKTIGIRQHNAIAKFIKEMK